MPTILQRQLNNLPNTPGIYEFFNAKQKLLYVGKAKNLRSRVHSYFQPGAELSPAKKIMARQVHHLTTTEVANETEALLLERTLIKQHQPPFNIDLRDDKSWLYIAIDYNQYYPTVEFFRRPTPSKKVKLFGPYVAASSIRQLFPFFKKTLGLKTCSLPANKPCFQASLGRCLGHNLGPGSKRRYHQQLKYFEQLMKGDVSNVTATLSKEMQQAAKSKDYERAARIRDQLRALRRLQEKQSVVSTRRESFDVYGLAQSGNAAAIVRLPIRRGVLLESDRFLLEHNKGLDDNEILAGFFEQYASQATNLVKKVYLPIKLKTAPVSKLSFRVAERGTKRRLVNLANKSAQNHLEQSVASWQRKEVRAREGLKQLKTIFNLPAVPKRIEGFDISNIQGKEAVGSMVVLTNGLPDSKHYRKFKIQAPAKPNDVRMLAEMLVRRFTKNTDWPKPDLIILDGGAAQLSTVKKALSEFKINLPLTALAKREELIYLPNKKEPLKLPSDSAALLLLESLRDEAHRFGITYYRSRHRKKTVKSAWDELPGVGPVFKKKLKAAYGSIRTLRQANEQELTKIVGQVRATAIKNYLS